MTEIGCILTENKLPIPAQWQYRQRQKTVMQILTKDNYFCIKHINDIFVEKYGTEAEDIPQNEGK